MKIKDHFLTQETFEIVKTDIDGILKTSPLPDYLGRYYESKNYISHHQDSGSFKEKIYKFLQGFNLKYKKKIILKCFENPSKAVKILDYGCGAGEFIRFMADDFTTFGFEPNENARQFAQQKNQKTQFITQLSEIPDGSLDLITLWHAFEHIENQAEILDLFYSKLSSSGKLIIAVPNHTSYDGQKYGEFWAAYDVPRHIWHFSKRGMLQLMNNNRWQVSNIQPLLLDAFYISMLSEKYKKNPLFWFFGGIHGIISNFKAVKTGEFSSLIYIIKKN